MRVLQVAWEFPPRLFGGLGRHVEGLTGALLDDGTSVTVLTPHAVDDTRSGREGLQVLRADPPAAPLPEERWLAGVVEANVAMALRGLTARVEADVLHVHDWMAAHAGRILAAALQVPLVATIHATERGRHMGHLPPGYSGWIDAQERALVAAAETVVVCSAHMGEQVRRWLGARRIAVIANGVDLPRWAVPARRRPRRIVFAGRLEHEKGVHVLLAATQDLSLDGGVEVVVAGRGTQAGSLRRLAHSGTRFVGHLEQPRLAQLLASASVAVVPSLYEPFGLAALEAMAAGTPVVASDVGGLPAVLGPAGWLVPPDDAAALRRALRRLLGDPAEQQRLRVAGQARAAEMTWEVAARRHRDLYLSLGGAEHG